MVLAHMKVQYDNDWWCIVANHCLNCFYGFLLVSSSWPLLCDLLWESAWKTKACYVLCSQLILDQIRSDACKLVIKSSALEDGCPRKDQQDRHILLYIPSLQELLLKLAFTKNSVGTLGVFPSWFRTVFLMWGYRIISIVIYDHHACNLCALFDWRMTCRVTWSRPTEHSYSLRTMPWKWSSEMQSLDMRLWWRACTFPFTLLNKRIRAPSSHSSRTSDCLRAR